MKDRAYYYGRFQIISGAWQPCQAESAPRSKLPLTIAAIASAQRSVARGRLMAAVAQTILCLITHPFFEDDKMENIGNVSFWLFKFLPINIHDPIDS